MKEREEWDERREDGDERMREKKDISRVIPVYYNFGLVFIELAIIIISNNIVPTEIIAEIWEHDNISKTRSNGARNMSSCAIMQI